MKVRKSLKGIAEKIDRAGLLDIRIKALESELKILKNEIKEFAKSENRNFLQGKLYACDVLPLSRSEVDIDKLWTLTMKDFSTFKNLVNPVVGKIDQWFKQTKIDLADRKKIVSKVEIDSFGMVRFKKVKGE